LVEVGVKEQDRKLQAIVKTKLDKIVSDYSFREKGKTIYRGHPAVYCDAAAETFELVQKSGGLSRKNLLERKPHWHEDFRIIVARDLEEHNYILATEIVRNLAKHTSEERPVIWVTPVGPMGHYPIVAEIMNKLRTNLLLKPELIFPFAMDEWSNENGNAVIDPKFTSYVTGFAKDMQEQFYCRLMNQAKIPEENLRYAAGEGLEEYLPAIENLLEQKAGVVFTGGVGMAGHIMFWEPTYGAILGKELSEKVIYVRGAPLTSETIAQNRFTSSASAPVPPYANTIGLGLFCIIKEYEKKNPEKVNVFFGLDNVEEPLIWQRFIAQSMLAMKQTDPSFGATYPATLPGAYIIVENHLKGFKVPSK
jgi:hypothetical protein